MLGFECAKPLNPKSKSFLVSEPQQSAKVLKAEADRLKHLEALGISVCQPGQVAKQTKPEPVVTKPVTSKED